MQIGLRDRIATAFVIVGVGLAVTWWASAPFVETLDVRSVSIAVTALGMLASASAVVPGFGELLRGSRSYLVGTSVLGTLALIAAGVSIVYLDERALVALVVATIVLWAVSTVRHAGAYAGSPAALRP
ncbi:MAG TPA: hypothetical protein VFU17_15920 [Candidatus Limnocylindrales bacterium]|nr:hypothetical protein [Candidatus Limnocylindrales bacterium]